MGFDWPVRAVAWLDPAAGTGLKSSDAYLFIDVRPGRSGLRWDIALREVGVALTLDTDGKRDRIGGENRAAWPRIDALTLAELDPTHHGIVRQSGVGSAATLRLPVPAQFGWALFQFKLGLELGQLCRVRTVVRLLLVLRRRAGYMPVVQRAGSALALLMAAAWLVERASDWRLLSS